MSFSRYWDSRVCPAAGLPKNALSTRASDVFSEPSSQMLIGRFYHSLVKAVARKVEQGMSKEESTAEEFPKVVQQYSERYPNLNLDYDPFVQRIYDTVRNDIEFGGDEDRELHVEIEISSSDSLLFGSPDWVMIRKSGTHLIDFKLTTKPDRLLSEKNSAQLAFYSYLVMDFYGQLPTDVQLVGLNGASAQVQISRDEANQIAEEARKCQRRISEVGVECFTLEDIARPSPQVCAHCRYREICGKAVFST